METLNQAQQRSGARATKQAQGPLRDASRHQCPVGPGEVQPRDTWMGELLPDRGRQRTLQQPGQLDGAQSHPLLETPTSEEVH